MTNGRRPGEGTTGLSQVWLGRIGGSLAMAVILALLLLRFYVKADTAFGMWTLVLLLPAGFLVWILLEWTTGPLIRRLSAALFRMQASPIEVARVHGVSVLLDRTGVLPALALLPGISFAPVAGLVGILAYYAGLLLHECGHALVARREGCHVYTVEVHALHGLTTFTEPARHRSRVLIAWGGVAAQMLVAIPAWICLKFLPDGAPDPLWVALIVLGPAAVLSVAVNLLPLRGLDGEMAWQLLRRRRANPGRVVQFRQGGRHGR